MSGGRSRPEEAAVSGGKEELMGWTIHNQDVMDALAKMTDASMMAMLTDPPYGLSDHTPEEIIEVLKLWLDGKPYVCNKNGFMAANWDGFVPGPEVWRECYRVLMPGAFAFVFCGSRTHDLMSIAMRLAGFRTHPTLSWVNGAGFPKASRIDTAYDRMSGEERETVGVVSGMGKQNPEWNGTAKGCTEDSFKPEYAITKPETEMASRWTGHRYGLQALKPAVEFIICVQKPYEGKSIECITKTGAGALNIDAGRISGVVLESEKRTSDSGDSKFFGISGDGGEGHHPIGRWPANFVIQHTPWCECVGEKKVSSGNHGSAPGGFNPTGTTLYGKGDPEHDVSGGYAGEDGKETVAAWHCAIGCPCGHVWTAEKLGSCPACRCTKTEWICPVAKLDQQAGKCGAAAPVSGEEPSAAVTNGGVYQQRDRVAGVFHDDGNDAGPSRFFFNGSWHHEIAERLANADAARYCSKSSRAERNAGVGSPPPLTQHNATLRKVQNGIEGEDGDKAARNSHPCVKPLKLCKWLCDLLGPPAAYAPRRILIPFSGSGSEMAAAILSGQFEEVVGIESSLEYVTIAEKRLAFWSEQMKKHGGDVEQILKAAGKVKSAPVPPKESGGNDLTPEPVSVDRQGNEVNQGELF